MQRSCLSRHILELVTDASIFNRWLQIEVGSVSADYFSLTFSNVSCERLDHKLNADAE